MRRRYVARRTDRPPSSRARRRGFPVDRGTGPRHRWLAAIPHPKPASAFGFAAAPKRRHRPPGHRPLPCLCVLQFRLRRVRAGLSRLPAAALRQSRLCAVWVGEQRRRWLRRGLKRQTVAVQADADTAIGRLFNDGLSAQISPSQVSSPARSKGSLWNTLGGLGGDGLTS